MKPETRNLKPEFRNRARTVFLVGVMLAALGALAYEWRNLLADYVLPLFAGRSGFFADFQFFHDGARRFLLSPDDLSAEYRRCALAVAPILSGAGINVKVFEALLYNRACVTTSFAYRGYEEILRPAESVSVADGASEFIERCSELLGDPAGRAHMAEVGRAAVIEAFSFERFARVIDETLNEAIATKARAPSGQKGRHDG